MGFESKTKSVVYGIVAVLATAAMVYFGTGLFPWWPLMWFAPAPVLLFAARSSWRGSAVVAFAAWFLGALNLRTYFQSLLHIPIGVQLVIYLDPALLFAIVVLLFRALLRRGLWWSALIAFPAAWVSFEYLTSLTSPHGTAGNLAYSQLNFLSFLQIASVTGPWGISFLLMLFPAALIVAIERRRKSGRQGLLILGASWGLIGLALAFGALRLSTPVPGERIKVALTASDEPEYVNVPEGAAADRLFRAYAGRVEELARRGTKAIVLPEKLAVVLDSDHEKVDATFQSLADRTKAVIVVGMVYVAPPEKYNRARVYMPGAAVQSYDKHHMLPPFESNLKPGTSTTVLTQGNGTWGVEICKDMDFTGLSREYGRAGAGLMLVPAWDFVADRFSHGHLAVMRGVEDGFSMVRAAKQGYLTVTDDRGRVLAEERSDAAPFASLLAQVPVAHEKTLYSLLGDWFAWVACASFAFACVRLFRP